MESTAGPRIELLEKIGEGGYGQVWLARIHKQGEEGKESRIAAVKLELKTIAGFSISDEFDSMKEIGTHAHLIDYIEYAAHITKDLEVNEMNEDISKVQNHYLALEFAENRSLIDYLNSKKEELDQSWLKHWFR